MDHLILRQYISCRLGLFMKITEITTDTPILDNISKQTLFLNRVMLPHMDKKVHYIISENDLLVNRFRVKFFTEVVNILTDIQVMCNVFDKDLTFMEDKYEKSLSIIDKDNLSDYESYLTDSRYHLNALIDRLDLKITKYTNEKD